ncbi:MAG: NADH-quinone oxidoreductase subunit C, partial [Deltaproteobacteria bacterium]|nr:NADH-quinone oxidoreductase subunit C [Deltaproteobacteria bacterium]
MDGKKQELLIRSVKDNFRDAVLDTAVFRGEVTHLVEKSALSAICNFLKTDQKLRMNYIVDVVGVDYHTQRPRFEVVY